VPIHDQGYRRYGGDKIASGRAWLVIAGAGIRTFITRRAFLGLLLASWLPFFARALQIYASANLPQASFLTLTPETFREFLEQQAIFVFFITVYVGSGLIANDRRANALQIYLSKPLTRTEYVLGKLAVLMTFLLLVTWIPGLLLLLVQVLFAGSFTFLVDNLYLFPAITLVAFIETSVAAVSMLALSSLSNSSRYVGILYTSLIFFSQALFGVLQFVTGGSNVAWVSVQADLSQVARAIFRQPLQYNTPWPIALLVLALLIGLSSFVLEKRVRAVEVVA
jgi:ABC-type transport system involved in multi-copper enzyme maturation permease subunit